jgi:NADH-quinone oxidoreductase subunit C
MSEAALNRAKELLGASVLSTHAWRGDETIVVETAKIRWALETLKNDGMDFLVDLTAVDYLPREPRYEVVYHLRSMKTGARLRVKAQLADPDGGNPVIDSIAGLWSVADWLEREVWDMYGIKFKDHPDMRRILMYEEFIGHPLRKDYPKEKRQPLIRRDPSDV